MYIFQYSIVLFLILTAFTLFQTSAFSKKTKRGERAFSRQNGIKRACLRTDMVVGVEDRTPVFHVERLGHTADLCMLMIEHLFFNIVTKKQCVLMHVEINMTGKSDARHIFGVCDVLSVWRNQKKYLI